MTNGKPKLISDSSYIFLEILVYPIILEGGVLHCIMSLNKSNKRNTVNAFISNSENIYQSRRNVCCPLNN